MRTFIATFVIVSVIRFVVNVWRIIDPDSFVLGAASERRAGVLWIVASVIVGIWGASLLGWV